MAGIGVVDPTDMPMAPYTTQVPGEMDADVVKVHPPEGDPIRDTGPHRGQYGQRRRRRCG